MKKVLLLSVLMAAIVLYPAAGALAQVFQQQIPQTVIIDGQQVQGVDVISNGTAQSVSCPSPQPYTAANGSSSGWACYDQNSGTWLLNALPPQQSVGVYPQQEPGYYGDYPAAAPYYPYGYYPYAYP